MGDVSFEAAADPLPAVALKLMQNLPDAEVIAMSTEIESLRHRSEISDQVKALLLGLLITNRVGTDVLVAAKWSLGSEILKPGARGDALGPSIGGEQLSRTLSYFPMASSQQDEEAFAAERSEQQPTIKAVVRNGGGEKSGMEEESDHQASPAPAEETPSSAEAEHAESKEGDKYKAKGLPQTPQTP